jgi:hypothetical protein
MAASRAQMYVKPSSKIVHLKIKVYIDVITHYGCVILRKSDCYCNLVGRDLDAQRSQACHRLSSTEDPIICP